MSGIDDAIKAARGDITNAIWFCRDGFTDARYGGKNGEWITHLEVDEYIVPHVPEKCPRVAAAIASFEALVALRAHYEVFEDVSVKHRDRDDSRHHQFCPGCAAQRRRIDELDAEAERLLAGGAHDTR